MDGERRQQLRDVDTVRLKSNRKTGQLPECVQKRIDAPRWVYDHQTGVCSSKRQPRVTKGNAHRRYGLAMRAECDVLELEAFHIVHGSVRRTKKPSTLAWLVIRGVNGRFQPAQRRWRMQFYKPNAHYGAPVFFLVGVTGFGRPFFVPELRVFDVLDCDRMARWTFRA